MSLANAQRVKVDGKDVDKNNINAEATGNTILKDGIVMLGKNPAKSANLVNGSVQDAGDEPGRTGSIHLHPTHKDMKISLYNGQSWADFNIHGGRPSGGPGERSGDYEEHARSQQAGQTTNGVRSVMVDEKFIYLYNSNSNQTIKIPRL
jgi:hypothetical protein